MKISKYGKPALVFYLFIESGQNHSLRSDLLFYLASFFVANALITTQMIYLIMYTCFNCRK
jgi:hypothetical protein